MKHLLLILLFASLAGNINKSFSWDSTAAKYYPLAVGNKWIYNHYWGWSGNTRIVAVIIDTLITNGHKYYKLRSQIPPPGSGYSESFLRIDSLTGSVRYYANSGGCPWLTNEITGDSLSSGYLDSFKTDCNLFIRAASDTSLMILGQVRLTKAYYWGSFESSSGRGYAKDIGKTGWYFFGPAGTSYQVTIRGCIINGIVYGDTSLTGINQISTEVPDNYSLSQNYPNPFNPITNIKFQMPNSGFVKLVIYDVLGKEIQTLVNEQLSAGTYKADWDALNYPSGVYYYRIAIHSDKLVVGDGSASLTTDNTNNREYAETKKMVLIK